MKDRDLTSTGSSRYTDTLKMAISAHQGQLSGSSIFSGTDCCVPKGKSHTQWCVLDNLRRSIPIAETFTDSVQLLISWKQPASSYIVERLTRVIKVHRERRTITSCFYVAPEVQIIADSNVTGLYICCYYQYGPLLQLFQPFIYIWYGIKFTIKETIFILLKNW